MDKISKETRSRNMSAIKSKNSKPEIAVRKVLYSAGYRYRLFRKDLPGKPDIALCKYKAVIFVHGCFWHHHNNCKYATLPKSNTEYWSNKLRRNVERDEDNISKLAQLGYKVLVLWECEVIDKNTSKIKAENILNKVDCFLNFNLPIQK